MPVNRVQNHRPVSCALVRLGATGKKKKPFWGDELRVELIDLEVSWGDRGLGL